MCPLDRDPDIYGIRALKSCRARQNRCSIIAADAGTAGHANLSVTAGDDDLA